MATMVTMVTMTREVHGFWSLIEKSARMLIILACFASAQAGSPQDAALKGKGGCRDYQDQKSIEPLKKFVEPGMKQGCVACHLDCNKLSPADRKEPPEYYLKALVLI